MIGFPVKMFLSDCTHTHTHTGMKGDMGERGINGTDGDKGDTGPQGTHVLVQGNLVCMHVHSDYAYTYCSYY